MFQGMINLLGAMLFETFIFLSRSSEPSVVNYVNDCPQIHIGSVAMKEEVEINETSEARALHLLLQGLRKVEHLFMYALWFIRVQRGANHQPRRKVHLFLLLSFSLCLSFFLTFTPTCFGTSSLTFRRFLLLLYI